MLTEAEKKWLEERAVESCEACREPDELFCSLCSRDPRPQSLSADFFSMSGCEMTTNWQDAAEFEARVAVYMTKGPCFQCTDKPGPNARYCIGAWGREGAEACRLKHARLAVEAEMED